MTPRATVRLQFNRDFTLDDAAEWVPYYAALGISHLYASPLFAARPGSGHGYDVIDPREINPELGGYAALLRLSRTLARHGMGLILDIVPNHMAADAANAWWWDVLLWGPASRHVAFFDIDWQEPDPVLRGKLLLPILGDTLQACLTRGEITLDTDEDAGLFVGRYFDTRFPIDPRGYGEILDISGPGWSGLRHGVEQLRSLDGAAFDSAAAKLRADLADRFRVARSAERESLLSRVNADPARLQSLLQRQSYVLTRWQDAATRINWRRFFDINGLAALRMDRAEVFDAYHRATLDLLRDGIIDGVRVDHVDGLADPIGYCRRLRAALDATKPGTYLVVEKILDKDETLGTEWPVDGTTGYDFMDQVSAALHDPAGEAALTGLWQQVSGDGRDFAAVARDARREMLGLLFPKALNRLLALLPEKDGAPCAADRAAMTALLAAMHRYRTYGDDAGMPDSDRAALDTVRQSARTALSPGEAAALDRICAALESPAASVFRTRFQQLSATLAAKAVEDTAFYRYGRLLSRNEVGSDPGRLAIAPETFHAGCLRRRAEFPQAMLATATHDHKRGEDARARLAVLSEIAAEWRGFAMRLLERTGSADAGTGYTIIQSIVGAWPLVFDPGDAAARRRFQERLDRWLIKALREAKQATSWARPDAAFESRWRDFLHRLLDPEAGFLGDLAGFVDRIAAAGALNGLSQTLLRLTVPGVPDLYRGTEFWDFSLVDPDNRAPVEHAPLEAAALETLLPDWRSGRIKQALIARLLAFRWAKPALFATGSYEPLAISGKRARHLIGFVRRADGDTLVVLAPRFPGAVLGAGARPVLPAQFWEDTRIAFPDAGDRAVDDLLGGRAIDRDRVTCAAHLLAQVSLAALFIPRR
jgi:(1->4)-alpha-D-glucan 1-alpha-D-glucosylmutase